MSEARKKAEQLWDQEGKKQQREQAPDHVELRDRWLELYPYIAFGMGDWQMYEGGCWHPIDELEIKRQIMEVVEAARQEGVKANKNMLSSVMELCKIERNVPREMWDSDPDILVCENGTLHLPTRELREHRREDHATNRVPYEYDSFADASVFKGVLRKALPGASKFVQEFAGYALTLDTSLETALWFKGPRGSGKSTIMEGLVAMLGAKHGILGLAEIESSPFALAKIPGKTLLTSTEQPASYLRSTHIIDALISGETIMVDRKYREAEPVKPVGKVLWAMNDLPRIANTTSGIFRRVKIVEFPRLEGEADPDIKEYIKQEGAGILNWALDGLQRLQGRGKFEIPASVKTATEKFELSNDLPKQFVEECCRTGPEEKVTTRYLYEKYAEWCKEGGHKPSSINRVAEDWERLGFEYKKTKSGRYWYGLSVRSTLGGAE